MRNLDRHTKLSYGLLALSTLLVMASAVLPHEVVDRSLWVGTLGFVLGAAFTVGLLRPAHESQDLPAVLSGVSAVAGLLVLKYGKFPGAFGVAAFCVVVAVVGAFFVVRSRSARRML